MLTLFNASVFCSSFGLNEIIHALIISAIFITYLVKFKNLNLQLMNLFVSLLY
jgi:hypothetical protein